MTPPPNTTPAPFTADTLPTLEEDIATVGRLLDGSNKRREAYARIVAVARGVQRDSEGAPTLRDAAEALRVAGMYGASAFVLNLAGAPTPPAVSEDTLTFAEVEYLFRELPFTVRQRWGGDAREFIEGIRFAIRAAPSSSPSTGDTK